MAKVSMYFCYTCIYVFQIHGFLIHPFMLTLQPHKTALKGLDIDGSS